MNNASRRVRKRGRPTEKAMPGPIPDTPQNVALALVTTPPKDDGDWDYLKDSGEAPKVDRKSK